jgi:hypothetical protein
MTSLGAIWVPSRLWALMVDTRHQMSQTQEEAQDTLAECGCRQRVVNETSRETVIARSPVYDGPSVTRGSGLHCLQLGLPLIQTRDRDRQTSKHNESRV